MKKTLFVLSVLIGSFISCAPPNVTKERTVEAKILGIIYHQRLNQWSGAYIIWTQSLGDVGKFENGEEYQTWFILDPLPPEFPEVVDTSTPYKMKYLWIQRLHDIPVVRALDFQKSKT